MRFHMIRGSFKVFWKKLISIPVPILGFFFLKKAFIIFKLKVTVVYQRISYELLSKIFKRGREI